jgi:hypothetical protein
MPHPPIDPHGKLDKRHVPQWLGADATQRFHVMAKPGRAPQTGSAWPYRIALGFRMNDGEHLWRPQR